MHTLLQDAHEFYLSVLSALSNARIHAMVPDPPAPTPAPPPPSAPQHDVGGAGRKAPTPRKTVPLLDFYSAGAGGGGAGAAAAANGATESRQPPTNSAAGQPPSALQQQQQQQQQGWEVQGQGTVHAPGAHQHGMGGRQLLSTQAMAKGAAGSDGAAVMGLG